MTQKTEVAKLVAKIGPDLCSSDESDSNSDTDETMESNNEQLVEKSGSGVKSWRGASIVTCFDALRTKGLYYGRQVGHSRPSRTSGKPPPDGTPLSWVSEEYLDGRHST
jgi:hypothetical protein